MRGRNWWRGTSCRFGRVKIKMEQSKVIDENREDGVKSSVGNRCPQVRRALVRILETGC